MTPQISVITSVYNALPYLEEALESILNQTFQNFEFIIIDDGSTDGSSDVIRSYSAKDKRIRTIFLKTNRGMPYASNCGLKKARAPLIAKMDGDDISPPERLQKQYDFMRKNPQIGLLGSGYTCFREDVKGEKEILQIVQKPRFTQSNEREFYEMADIPVTHGVSMFRRSVVMKIGGYREACRYGAVEFDLFLRMHEITKVQNLPESLLYYRINRKSIFRSNKVRSASAGTAARLSALRRRRGEKDPVTLHSSWEELPHRFSISPKALRKIKRSPYSWSFDLLYSQLRNDPMKRELRAKLYLELFTLYYRVHSSRFMSIACLFWALRLDRKGTIHTIKNSIF